VFAQRRNFFNWRFISMLREILRFNGLATQLAISGQESQMNQALGEFLDEHHFSQEFRDWYFLPMMACIWSCPTSTMMAFPVSTMVRFCHNHGLIQVNDRPRWWTVKGGAKHYVEKIIAGISDKRLNTPVRRIQRDSQGVTVSTDAGSERFDKVVLATHSDQSLKLLADPSTDERRALGAVQYQLNRAVLHTDASVLPQTRKAWAAWNYESAPALNHATTRVCLHYLINKLQPIPFDQPVVVSLNPLREISSEHVLGAYDYSHPVFDRAAIKAQAEMPSLQGINNTYFCGAWLGYGFHEDGLKSGLNAAKLCMQEVETTDGVLS
jgi:predicted NAD/FAD-binding protein